MKKLWGFAPNPIKTKKLYLFIWLSLNSNKITKIKEFFYKKV